MIGIFEPTMPLSEIALRTTIVYLAIIFVVRITPKRNAGHISPNDILTLIVIGSIATDAIAGASTSLGDLGIMIVLVIGWGYVLDRLEYRFPGLRRLLRHRQTPLIN